MKFNKYALIFLVLSFNSTYLIAGERSIEVSGKCLRKIFPDRGAITLVAEFINKNAAQASSQAMKQYEEIRNAIVKLKLKDVELATSEYNVVEQFDYVANKQASRGYLASMGLRTITSDISRLGEIIELSSKFGVRRVEGLNTFASQSKMKSEQESCLDEAIKNAKSKADRMAKAANEKVGKVLKINEFKDTSVQPPSFANEAYANDDEMAANNKSYLAPRIESKAEDLVVNVHVVYELN